MKCTLVKMKDEEKEKSVCWILIIIEHYLSDFCFPFQTCMDQGVIMLHWIHLLKSIWHFFFRWKFCRSSGKSIGDHFVFVPKNLTSLQTYCNSAGDCMPAKLPACTKSPLRSPDLQILPHRLVYRKTVLVAVCFKAPRMSTDAFYLLVWSNVFACLYPTLPYLYFIWRDQI